jgi:hypothetical protein
LNDTLFGLYNSLRISSLDISRLLISIYPPYRTISSILKNSDKKIIKAYMNIFLISAVISSGIGSSWSGYYQPRRLFYLVIPLTLVFIASSVGLIIL